MQSIGCRLGGGAKSKEHGARGMEQRSETEETGRLGKLRCLCVSVLVC